MLNRKIALSILLFLTCFCLFLIVWIRIAPYYGHLLLNAGPRLSAWSMGVRIEEIRYEGEDGVVTFVRPVYTKGGLAEAVLDIRLSSSGYSFNAPLTFALVVGLLPFFRWQRRSFLEVVVILCLVHLLCIYFACSLQILYNLSSFGGGKPAGFMHFVLELCWTFCDKLLIRFEPFLVVVYLWLRNMDETPTGHFVMVRKRSGSSA